ncbi:MAG: hypothetical protein L6R41_002102 [Letrouitia leprolyta]|nr:MAG: hypothetical protein L6R41_002102 [Letrouitia leprolyta]
MPGKALTPGKATKCSPQLGSSGSKVVDSGTSLSVYDTNSVRDRVRQWQAQGGGVVDAPDIYCEDKQDDTKNGEACGKPAAIGKDVQKPATVAEDKNTPVGPDRPRSRSGRPGRKSSTRGDRRDRSKSTPAKRVVSDAHWRKDRSPLRDRASPTSLPKTPRRMNNEDSDNIRVKSPVTSKRADFSGKEKIVKEGNKEKYPMRASRNPSRHRSRHTFSPTGSTSSVSVTEDNNSASPKTLTQLPSATGSAHYKVTSRKARSQAYKSPATIVHVQKLDSQPSSEAFSQQESPFVHGSSSEQRKSKRVQKDHILAQTLDGSKKASVKQQATLGDSLRVPSVELWLNNTPDPFIENEEPLIEGTVSHSTLSKTTDPTPNPSLAADPNKIRDTLESNDRVRSGLNASRRRKRIPSSTIYKDNPFPIEFEPASSLHTSLAGSTSASKLVDLFDGANSTPCLARRGAQKSVSSPKRRLNPDHLEEELLEGDKLSVQSSNHTISSVDDMDLHRPLRPPRLKRRPIPSTGKHRLSTIASVDTSKSKLCASDTSDGLEDHASEPLESKPRLSHDDAEARELESGDRFDAHSLKPRLTKHADLISVLSMAEAGNKSIRSARSIRTARSRLATATVADLMTELANDEKKYVRELKTLVDGVIPVLLSCVLSKSDSAVAAGLFRPNFNTQEDPNFTKPIVDMGIALERLKALHRRIPLQDSKSLLTWAHRAQRVYAEYLKAWRMGFQDVVVNLAPATEGQASQNDTSSSRRGTLDDGLPINKDGDVVNGDGERVDVAFLLKRPLIRLKYLSKTLKGINIVSPSAEAESLASKYQNLVITARNRSNEERARLDDEAAANIDATRARDPRTLAPLTGVSIDRTRRVRARDHFNLGFQHSSGQRVDCRVELLLRDEASDDAGSGDLLICEVDGTGRWLLFPPVRFGRVSARNGDLEGEIIVMIRGFSGSGVGWHEILSLKGEDEEAGFEWVQMLGLTPVPPKILRTQSFLTNHRRKGSTPTSAFTLDAPPTQSPAKSRTPSPREVETPIGEQPVHNLETFEGPRSNEIEDASSDAGSGRTVNKLQRKSQEPTVHTDVPRPHTYVDDVNDLRSLPSQSYEQLTREQELVRRPRSFKEALGLTGTSTNSLGLKRTRAQKLTGHPGSPKSSRSPKPSSHIENSQRPSQRSRSDSKEREVHPQGDYSAPIDGRSPHRESPASYEDGATKEQKDSCPGHNRSPSSVPSIELPIIPKIRKDSPPTTPTIEFEEEPQWLSPPYSELAPSSPRKTEKRLQSSVVNNASASPSISDHRSSSSPSLEDSKSPIFSPNTTPTTRRRSSSPLKHQYEPSTASESSDSEASTVERNEVSSMSSSEDEDLEAGDIQTPLLPLGALGRLPKPSSHGSLYSMPNGTLRPSESASQAPYKTVPSQPTKASKTIASIFSWSDKGSWESLHPDECSIMITPGLIEAYEMSAAHSACVPLSSSTPVVDVDAFSELASNVINAEDVMQNNRPLVALELTPLVPLRRGTAIDISIRSPPIALSQITTGTNIMFRSRNPEECEALYALINHARIHNPTYIALQNARGPFDVATGLDRRTSNRAAGSRTISWFGGWRGSSGYRASSAPTPSIAPSESSIGSMSSAFSALKRFGRGGGGMFNIARSTISSREGSRANSIYTSSDNSSGSGTSSPLPPGMQGDPNGQIGLSNTKIRLYFRETQTRWRDMGSARLTIMRPTPPDLSSGISASGESSLKPSTARQGADEKRIVVCGKTKGEILLDATLGETCFERVGRQGIAVCVWEDIVGPNGELGTVGAVGGVGAGRAKVYMIQDR